MNTQIDKQNPQQKEKIPVPGKPEQAPVQEPGDRKKEAPMIGNEKGGALPYVFAWILGVPLSLLVLVALFRALFN